MALRGVGIDIVDVARIRRLVESRGDAFTSRWFTSEEVAQCAAAEDPVNGFAARLAAKEAVWKSLALDGKRPVPWRAIAVLSTSGGATVSLGEELESDATAIGVGHISVSTATIDDLALAVAMTWLVG